MQTLEISETGVFSQIKTISFDIMSHHNKDTCVHKCKMCYFCLQLYVALKKKKKNKYIATTSTKKVICCRCNKHGI